MATRKNPKVSLPKQWTNAQVRVNPQGKVQVKIAASKVNPERSKYGKISSVRGFKKASRKRFAAEGRYGPMKVTQTQFESMLKRGVKRIRGKKRK